MIVGQVGDARSSVKAKRQHEKYVGEHEPASNVSDQNEEDSGQKMSYKKKKRNEKKKKEK